MFNRIVFIFLAAFLTACTTTDDPRKGGLISGMSSLESGAYERRVESLRQRANRARQENIKLSEQNQRLKNQRDADARTLVRVNLDISRTSQQLTVLHRQIASKKTSKNTNRAELARIKKSIDTINARINRLKREKPVVKVVKNSPKRAKPTSVNPNTISQLEKRKKELSTHYESLLELLESQL